MKIVVYRDAAGEWRWTLKAANGEPIADSAEGYVHHAHAVTMAERIAGRMSRGTRPVEIEVEESDA